MNSKMNLSALLILVLLCSLELASSTLSRDTGNDCCLKYGTMKIPLAMVVSFYKTSSSCPIPAFVFVTKRGKRICVNPADGWVMSHAAEVAKRSTTPVPVTSTDTPTMPTTRA